jgi:hypothetical protein
MREIGGVRQPDIGNYSFQSTSIESIGQMYPWRGSGIVIYSINTGNRALTLVKALFLNIGGTDDLTRDPSGKFLCFVTNEVVTGLQARSPSILRERPLPCVLSNIARNALGCGGYSGNA